MLYPSIVLNSIFNIISLNDLFSLFVLFLAIFLLYILWNKFSKDMYMYRLLIISIRLLILILIIPLIQNKIFRNTESISRKQNIAVVIDNSMSMNKILNSNDSLNLKSITEPIQNWANSNNLNLYWYDLDGSIQLEKLIFDRKNSSFDYLEKILIHDNMDQLFFLSDGNVNQGFLSDDRYTNQSLKINTLGLGNVEEINQNIKINQVQIESLNDSIKIKTQCWANINQENCKVIFNIFTDAITTKIYTDTLILELGKYNFDKNINLKSSYFNNTVFVSLEPLNFSDQKIYDNQWNIDINKNKSKNILFLTGKLTYNTSFLKNIFSKISLDFNFTQWVAINDTDESDFKEFLNDYDYIVFDNFPNSSIHIDLLNEIHALKIPVIFFEGYDFDEIYLEEILNLYYPNNFYIESNKENNKNFNLGNNINIGSLYSNYNLFSNENNSIYLNYFSNNSISEIHNPKLSVFLIPNIAEIDFFMRTNYNNDYVRKYIEYIINNTLNNKEVMNFDLKKNNYLLGENLLFDFDSNKIPFDILESTLIIKDIKKNRIDSINYKNNMPIYLENSGKFEVYFLFKGTNDEVINSNIELFDVIKKNIELDNISQNEKLLKNISSKTKGKYINASNLNIDYFNTVDNNEIITTYNKIYNALDLFIKEKIYLLVIILFALEIFFRKRVGLL